MEAHAVVSIAEFLQDDLEETVIAILNALVPTYEDNSSLEEHLFEMDDIKPQFNVHLDDGQFSSEAEGLLDEFLRYCEQMDYAYVRIVNP